MSQKKIHEFADKYNFDYMPYLIEGSNKTPLHSKNWSRVDTSIKSNTLSNTWGRANGIAVIMKEDIGLILGENRNLVCIDIDNKENDPHGKEIFDNMVMLISEVTGKSVNDLLPCMEDTLNNGHHIFLTTDFTGKQEKILIQEKPKIEIEVFTESRNIVCHPTTNYIPYDRCGYIDFDVVADTFISYKDLREKILSVFGVTNGVTDKIEDTSDINEEWTIDQTAISKAEKGWTQLDNFRNGRSNADWDSICNNGSSYDYVRFSIMPWYIITGRVEEFISTIENYGKKYLSQWSKYPDSWTNKPKKERPIGKDARVRLRKIGYLKKAEDKTKEQLEYMIRAVLPLVVSTSFNIKHNTYTYNEDKAMYEPLTREDLQNKLILHYKNIEKMYLASSLVKAMLDTAFMHLRADNYHREDKDEL